MSSSGRRAAWPASSSASPRWSRSARRSLAAATRRSRLRASRASRCGPRPRRTVSSRGTRRRHRTRSPRRRRRRWLELRVCRRPGCGPSRRRARGSSVWRRANGGVVEVALLRRPLGRISRRRGARLDVRGARRRVVRRGGRAVRGGACAAWRGAAAGDLSRRRAPRLPWERADRRSVATASSSPICVRGCPATRFARVHWRASARTRGPYVAERHPERSAEVVLFLDTFAELPSGARERTLTLTVRAAAALAEAHLRARDRVGVVRFGGALEWLRPGSGVLHALRIADALARSEIVMTYVARDVAVVPPAILPPRALVLAITPLLDERGARGAARPRRARPRPGRARGRRARDAGRQRRPRPGPVGLAARLDALPARRARARRGDVGRRSSAGAGHRGGDGIPTCIAAPARA